MSPHPDAPRSLLFVPASGLPKLVESAGRSGADAIVFDLEDGTPRASRRMARDNLRALEPSLIQSGFIRVSAPTDDDFAEDAALVRELRPRGVVLAKCDSVLELSAATGLLPSETPVLALIESARALLQAENIASAQAVIGLALGSEDLALDIGWRSRSDVALDMARWRVLVAARAWKKWAIDSASMELSRSSSIAAEARRSALFGFDGKLVIHPRQVPFVHSAFDLTPTEIRQAKRSIERYLAGLEVGRAAVAVGGRMVDRPVAERARLLLERHEARKALDAVPKPNAARAKITGDLETSRSGRGRT